MRYNASCTAKLYYKLYWPCRHPTINIFVDEKTVVLLKATYNVSTLPNRTDEQETAVRSPIPLLLLGSSFFAGHGLVAICRQVFATSPSLTTLICRCRLCCIWIAGIVSIDWTGATPSGKTSFANHDNLGKLVKISMVPKKGRDDL